ncbi:anti-sigma factor family protein [Anaeromyxobacter oryzae]|uniref:Putative zinc-finger domain-containing protein n=1 Tax=Anaeromyxobacter oryzae TaxID=2918170 RepID=A0ABM7X441_9BACT|nr:zf-HC2 domain-containing protein [Anaeromyxobacter oryzae]BDG06549.1 hypothetical protein AMOR_55450 [Anaeromyxobacter oryzae]
MTTFTGHLTDAQAQRLVDGVLLETEAAEVEAHVAGCAACQAEVESYRLLGDALEGLEIPELPADFTVGVLERIETRERAVAHDRRAAAAIFGAALGGIVLAVVLLGAGTWAPEASRLVEGLGDAGRALRLSSDVLGPIVSALRIPIAAACAAAALPVLFALSRLMPSPRTEIA